VPAGASDPRRLLPLLALAAALAGCPSRDPTVRPFRLTAIDATGRSIVEGFTQPGLVTVAGAASRPDLTTLVVTPPGGAPAVTLRFDPTAVPTLAFPDAVASGNVAVEIRQDPAARGPGGEPLLIRGLRVADASGRFRFLIGEGDLRSPDGLPLVPRPLGPEAAEDVPSLVVVAPFTAFEPSKCGDVYFDRLQVTNVVSEVVLGQDETAKVSVLGGEDLPWNLVHVASWHRGGGDVHGDGCDTALRAWFQGAGFR
jgi:hypothetical protein